MNKPITLLIAAFICGCVYTLPTQGAPTEKPKPAVKQGYHTTGRGNKDAVMLCIDMGKMTRNTQVSRIDMVLKGNTHRNIDRVKVYQTATAEFYSLEKKRRQLLCTVLPHKGKMTLNLNGCRSAGDKPYLWITADVSPRATLEDYIDAKITALGYRTTQTGRLKTVYPADGDPDYGMKIFALQQFLYTPYSFGCKNYRIPAMIVAADGSIVTAIDRRYEQSNDLGNHKIDVAVRRSTDNGKTWSEPLIIAQGDSLTEGRYGYGDASFARTSGGKILCLMSAGKKSFFEGMRYIAMQSSSDNGITWQTAPVEITTGNFTDSVFDLKNGTGMYAVFVSSGKGLTTRRGDVMFLCDCITEPNGHEKNFLLKSTDEGRSWKLGPTLVYDRANEAKLIEKNDGTLLASVRQHGFRGFNKGSADGRQWNRQWRSNTLWGADCNADIIYYTRNADGNGKRDMMLHSILKSERRKNLTIYKSHDEGNTWTEVFNIQPGDASYSTMEVLNDGSLAVLYEDNSNQGCGHTINFVVLTKEQVENFGNIGNE